MLYGLFSLQTNLHISLYYQPDILWHNGTNYKQLLFSSDIWASTTAMGICAFFYMWHWFGLVVFQRCMVYWGDVCHGCMCILLYVKLIWCSGVPEMYGWLLGGQWHSNNKRERGGYVHISTLAVWTGYVHISSWDGYLHISSWDWHSWFSVVVIQRPMLD